MATADVAMNVDVDEEILQMSAEDIARRTRLIENEIRVLKDEHQRLQLDQNSTKERIKDNMEKIKLNKQLPYLVGNVVEVLNINPDEEEEDGANVDLDSQRKGKCVVLKTSTRQTIFLPVIGLVEPEQLKPGDLVGVNKDSYLILDTLPAEYDTRVKAMEVDEKPSEDYSDIGGLDKQIQELVEAIVLPMTHKERKMNVNTDVNFEELARSTDDFNAAQLKAVCVEAGMLALRRDGTEVCHEDFVEGIVQVQAKKKASLNYYA
eukprot:jgi/Pico_ML_1/51175/g2254.t1